MLDVYSVHDMWLILIKDIWWLKWDLGKGKTCSNSHILWSYYSRHLIIPTHSSKSSSVKRPTLLFDMECESSFKGRGKRSSFPLSKPAAKTRKTSVKERFCSSSLQQCHTNRRHDQEESWKKIKICNTVSDQSVDQQEKKLSTILLICKEKNNIYQYLYFSVLYFYYHMVGETF